MTVKKKKTTSYKKQLEDCKTVKRAQNQVGLNYCEIDAELCLQKKEGRITESSAGKVRVGSENYCWRPGGRSWSFVLRFVIYDRAMFGLVIFVVELRTK